MKRLLLGMIIGAVLAISVGWIISEVRETSAAPSQQTTFQAESIISDADFNVIGDGGYLVAVIRGNGLADDVGGVVFYNVIDGSLFPTGTFLCIDDIGWDCYRW